MGKEPNDRDDAPGDEAGACAAEAPAPQPIPTEWRGIVFRSRLEARWALFMDELGLPYVYEQEAYDLPSRRYLPDFYVPRLSAFVEIKPAAPSRDEMLACLELADATRRRVALFFGAPGHWLGAGYAETDSGLLYRPNYECDDRYYFCVCPACKAVGLEYLGRGERVCKGDPHELGPGAKLPTHDAPAIRNAAHKANAYAFWAGGAR
jgi:hypothetical protein